MNPPTTQPHPAAGPVADQHPLTLLVLTSFFAESRHALGFAAALAAPLGARVVLLHVGQLTSPNDDIRLPPPPQASRELHEALRALASEQHVPTDFELVPDLLPGAAEDLARRYGPALFVLGRPAADRFDFDLGAARAASARNLHWTGLAPALGRGRRRRAFRTAPPGKSRPAAIA